MVGGRRRSKKGSKIDDLFTMPSSFDEAINDFFPDLMSLIALSIIVLWNFSSTTGMVTHFLLPMNNVTDGSQKGVEYVYLPAAADMFVVMFYTIIGIVIDDVVRETLTERLVKKMAIPKDLQPQIGMYISYMLGMGAMTFFAYRAYGAESKASSWGLTNDDATHTPLTFFLLFQAVHSLQAIVGATQLYKLKGAVVSRWTKLRGLDTLLVLTLYYARCGRLALVLVIISHVRETFDLYFEVLCLLSKKEVSTLQKYAQATVSSTKQTHSMVHSGLRIFVLVLGVFIPGLQFTRGSASLVTTAAVVTTVVSAQVLPFVF
eukprot:m.73105 g.73105  ORF g.73105 m.73105 type:complete len:318 (-) comp24523_c0_seq1:419-1372(-)